MNADALPSEPDAAAAGFEQLPLFLVMLEGPDFVVRAMNAAARATSARTGIGARFGQAFPHQAAFGVETVLERVYRTGEPCALPQQGQAAVPGGAGGEASAGLRVAPWREADGTVRGLLVFGPPPTAWYERGAAGPDTGVLARREPPHEIAVALQLALLPLDLPIVPGADLAACYLAAEQERTAGGDWFDALVLPGGRIAMVVGDVVGHGVEAATLMSRLRTVLGERLLHGESCAQAVASAGRYSRAQPGAIAATVCAAILHPGSGALAYSTAGHPPPLIVDADHATRFLEPTGDGPLAPGVSYTERFEQLASGATILLYSDGIIHRPGLPPARGMRELARTAAHASAGRPHPLDALDHVAERICRLTVEALSRSTDRADDITVLAATRTTAPHPLDLTVSADTDQLAVLRIELGLWLLDLGTDPRVESGLQHAIGELATNAIEHAYTGQPTGSPRPVRLHAHLADDGYVEVTVSDDGTWKPPDTTRSYHGYGLTMAAGLLDELTLTHDEHGTTARVRHQLHRPTLLHAPKPAAPPRSDPDPAGFEVRHHPDQHDRVEVSGILDADAATRLRTSLRRASANTTRPLTVDLRGVTFLGSAAVKVLFALHEQAADHGVDITLRAPAGSIADHVLTLVALPHDVDTDEP